VKSPPNDPEKVHAVFLYCVPLTLAACARAPNADQAADQAPATAPSAAATPAAAAATHAPMTAPAGHYVLDKAHGSLIFRVDHLGFSHFTARFKRFDAQLEFDPADLAHSSVTATVDATSIETDFPDPAKLDFMRCCRTTKMARHREISADDVPLDRDRADRAERDADQR
jgi:hypothetical protein